MRSGCAGERRVGLVRSARADDIRPYDGRGAHSPGIGVIIGASCTGRRGRRPLRWARCGFARELQNRRCVLRRSSGTPTPTMGLPHFRRDEHCSSAFCGSDSGISRTTDGRPYGGKKIPIPANAPGSGRRPTEGRRGRRPLRGMRSGCAEERCAGSVRAARADDIRPYVGAVRIRPGIAESSVRAAWVVGDADPYDGMQQSLPLRGRQGAVMNLRLAFLTVIL